MATTVDPTHLLLEKAQLQEAQAKTLRRLAARLASGRSVSVQEIEAELGPNVQSTPVADMNIGEITDQVELRLRDRLPAPQPVAQPTGSFNGMLSRHDLENLAQRVFPLLEERLTQSQPSFATPEPRVVGPPDLVPQVLRLVMEELKRSPLLRAKIKEELDSLDLEDLIERVYQDVNEERLEEELAGNKTFQDRVYNDLVQGDQFLQLLVDKLDEGYTILDEDLTNAIAVELADRIELKPRKE